MYDILFAPISKRDNGEEIAYDWAIFEAGVIDSTYAASIIANEMGLDIIHGHSFAYRLVEHEEW